MVRAAVAISVGALALVFGASARANCATVLDALDKAWQQDRLAQFDIDALDAPLTGKPFLVRINKEVWVNNGSGFDRTGDPRQNPMASSLRSDAAKGKVDCESLGSATYRGQPATKYRITGSIGSKSTGRPTLWIGKAGLPLYHEFELLGPGGFAWVYGDAVKEPGKK